MPHMFPQALPAQQRAGNGVDVRLEMRGDQEKNRGGNRQMFTGSKGVQEMDGQKGVLN